MCNNKHLDYFLTDNKSGWKSVPSKLKNNNEELYNQIVSHTNTNRLNELTFKEQIWYFVHNEKEKVLCQECGNLSRFLDLRRGYQPFCSVKCSNKNEKKITATKENNIKKWGVATPFENKEIYNKYVNDLQDKYGVTNYGQLDSIKKKIEATNIEKYGVKSLLSTKEFRSKHNVKTSKIETKVCNDLGFDSKFYLLGKEYDMVKDNIIIEVDSDYHHPDKINNLSLTQLSSVINDKQKIQIAEDNGYKLYHIKISDINKKDTINLNEIINNSYTPNHKLSYDEVIVSKEYLKSYIEKNGKDKLKEYLWVFLKFIREFQPEFPFTPQYEDINTVKEKINKYDINKIFNGKDFNNNSSLIGVNILKHTFPNYWRSSYKNDKSPYELWYDDNFMKKVISYRIGLNDSNEVYDFSIKNIIKGINSYRKPISFFKPVLAASIYKHYLGDKINPIVFDPCSGFGGRLLGFKSIYPEGTYIGNDPDKNTFKGLSSLSEHFSNVILHNSKLEDLDVVNGYDIIFTSIPYFDLEVYSDNQEYNDFKEWRETFINKLLSYPRLLINMSYELCERLNLVEYIDTYIVTNTSHFNKKNDKKKEVIVKLNF